MSTQIIEFQNLKQNKEVLDSFNQQSFINEQSQADESLFLAQEDDAAQGAYLVASSNEANESGDSENFIQKALNFFTGLFKKDNSGKDGTIGYTKQGSTGDCWLLSGINALSYNKKGQEIIKNALEYKDGYTIVHFAIGDVEVSDEEIERAQKSPYSSSGDLDMIIFEKAFTKIRDDIHQGEIMIVEDAPYWMSGIETGGISVGSSITGGEALEAYYFLTGKIGTGVLGEQREEMLDAYMNDRENIILCARTSNEGMIEDIEGNSVELFAPHAYSIKNVDEDTVTIVNPHDSSKEIVLSRGVFLDNFSGLEALNLSQDPEVDLTLDGKLAKTIIKDEDGRAIFKKYSWPDGRIYKKEVNEDGSITEQKIDTSGNMIEHIKSDNQTITTTLYSGKKLMVIENYDENGNVTSEEIVDYYDGNDNVKGKEITEYDKNGERNKTIRESYNENGKIKYTEEICYGNGETTGEVHTYYDENGNVTDRKTTEYDKGQPACEETVYYNENGNITDEKITYYDEYHKKSNAVEKSYDENGQVRCIREIFYESELTASQVITYYDENGNIVDVEEIEESPLLAD